VGIDWAAYGSQQGEIEKTNLHDPRSTGAASGKLESRWTVMPEIFPLKQPAPIILAGDRGQFVFWKLAGPKREQVREVNCFQKQGYKEAFSARTPHQEVKARVSLPVSIYLWLEGGKIQK
jgi:hypothetical protein